MRGLIFAAVAPLLVVYARDERHQAMHPLPRHLVLFALWYGFIVFAFWPIISPRDFLPLVPLFALAIGATPPRRCSTSRAPICTRR